MSTSTSAGFTFGVVAGNTIEILTQITSFSGTALNNTSLSSVTYNIFAPGVLPPSGTILTTITPTAISSTYQYAYYTISATATVGVYILQIQATTISSYNVTDYSKFRIIPVDV